MIYNFGSGTIGQFDGLNPIGDVSDVPNNGFKAFDPTSPDMGFVAGIVNDLFRRSAAPVNVRVRTDNGDINEVIDEDSNPTYWNPKPFDGFFVPAPMEFELTKWGVDSKNKLEVVFLRSDLFTEYGERLLRVGDVVDVPYGSVSKFQPGLYRVVNAQETGNYRYQWFYVTVQCELLPGDITVVPADVEKLPVNDYPIDL